MNKPRIKCSIFFPLHSRNIGKGFPVKVLNHPAFAPNTVVLTSQIVSISKDQKQFETLNSIYEVEETK